MNKKEKHNHIRLYELLKHSRRQTAITLEIKITAIDKKIAEVKLELKDLESERQWAKVNKYGAERKLREIEEEFEEFKKENK